MLEDPFKASAEYFFFIPRMDHEINFIFISYQRAGSLIYFSFGLQWESNIQRVQTSNKTSDIVEEEIFRLIVKFKNCVIIYNKFSTVELLTLNYNSDWFNLS